MPVTEPLTMAKKKKAKAIQPLSSLVSPDLVAQLDPADLEELLELRQILDAGRTRTLRPEECAKLMAVINTMDKDRVLRLDIPSGGPG